MKLYFRIVICFVILFSFSEAKAQISAGGGVVYGTDINNIGISLNGNYEINEKWSAAPSFTYFLKKDYVTWSAIDLDANYQLTDLEKFGSLYAIGGLNMTFFKVKYDFDFGEYGSTSGSATGSDAGLNLGLGLKIPAGKSLTIAPDLRYTLGGANYLRIGVKAFFSFSK